MRLLERCGFAREGVQRGAVRKEGVTLDLVLFGKVVR
jgi:RimJ/RimL family protein N-acetyltransferase